MRIAMLFVGAAVATLTLSSPVLAQDGAGKLECSVKGGFGFIVGGSRAVSCTYRRFGFPVEFYTGSASRIGLDVGPTDATQVTYRVSAAPATPGVLQGDFTGPEVSAAAAAGFSASALVGGGGVSLVPVPNGSTLAVTGLNFSGGLGQLHLQFAGVEHLSDRSRRQRVLRSYGIDDGN